MSERLMRAEIEALIPHKGTMCLLDAVESWDKTGIRCSTRSHADPANPLRRDGRLAGIHLAEYGAQAMAVHGGLLEKEPDAPPSPGVLVALRDFEVTVAYADDIAGALSVSSTRLVANSDGWLYSFAVSSAGHRLASGRVGVLLRR